MVAFDQLLAYKTKRPGFFKRLGGADKNKTKDLSLGEKVARTNMRRRANQFVDARDEMEGKLGRLSRRLAFLVHETDVWKERFTEFETLTEKLGSEASELKTRIEKEKRESRRLSTVVGEKEKEKENLKASKCKRTTETIEGPG
jgi:nicotinamide N-methyltransferase